MTLPASGTISILDLKNNYGSTVADLNSYHAGSGIVTSGSWGFPVRSPYYGSKHLIPTSGLISLDDFHYATVPVSYSLFAGGYMIDSLYIPAGTWKLMVRMQGAGGGGGGNDSYRNGAGGGDGAGLVSSFLVTSSQTTLVRIYGSMGGGGGYNQGGANGTSGAGGASIMSGYFNSRYSAIANGGAGGSIGIGRGSSGAGGGGGGAVALGWNPNPSGGGSGEILLALAGGGGGGSGSGLYSIIEPDYAPGNAVAWPWRTRSLTLTESDLVTLDADTGGSGFPPTARRLAGTNSQGQGGYNLSNFYPPGSVTTYNYDGGGAGGGGGGNGYGGGLTNAANGSSFQWVYTAPGTDKNGSATPEYWSPPWEGCGEGGVQGLTYVNPSYYASIYAYSLNQRGGAASYGQGYGLGASAQTLSGGDGAVWLKVTNDVDDTTFP